MQIWLPYSVLFQYFKMKWDTSRQVDAREIVSHFSKPTVGQRGWESQLAECYYIQMWQKPLVQEGSKILVGDFKMYIITMVIIR